jgi:hypothetical protein
MFVRRLRAATLLTVSAAALTTLSGTACVRGRNDGGRDGAGLSSNGAGPAPEPGPRAGQNTDTTMIAPAPAATAPVAGQNAATSQPATKKAP